MRVLHLIPTLFHPIEGIVGGAERYAYELARHMSRAAETTLVSFGPEERELSDGPLRIRVLRGAWHVRGSRFNPVSARVLPELLRADIVHCHQRHVLLATLAALAGRATGKRVFATDLGGGGWDLGGYVNTDSWFHGHLHISEFSRRVAGQTDEPRAQVIFSGVDTDKFSPDPGVSKTGGVLFVGRLLPHKGVDRVLEALPPDIPMEVIGRPYDPKYFDLLRSLAAGKQVTFRTDVDDRQLVEAYRRSRCVVLPSLYRDRYGNESTIPELMGQTLLEGMSTGIPGLCTDVAAMPESVLNGVTGLVVPPGNPDAMRHALGELYWNVARSERMGAAARQRMIDHFGWPAVVRRCLAAYRGESFEPPRANA
ncbi:MAG: glycosyltransferase family 4 protein [Myxococcaceae bacterium]